MKTAFILLAFVLSTTSYSQNYAPRGLKKVSNDQRLELIQKNIFPTSKTLYKDTLGQLITNVKDLDATETFLDLYLNDQNEIVECVARKMTEHDTKVLEQIIDFLQEKEMGNLVLKQVDCSQQEKILNEVLVKDQSNRTSGREIDNNIDKENLEKVLSIIEYCGFPNQKLVGNNGMNAVFLVLQHSTRKLRERFLPQIKLCALNGDLSQQEVALMEDRLLTESSKKQKYGSQVFSNGNNKWKLWPVEDIKRVNERRKAVGLGPLEEYLKRYNIVLDNKQK